MKKILLICVMAAILVGTWAVFKIFNDDSKSVGDSALITPAATEDKVTKVPPIPTSGTDSINTLIALGQNMECTISHHVINSTEAATEGTLFTSQNRMRGDFLIPELGMTAVSSMILQNGDLYSWTDIDGKKNGMKISLSELSNIKKNNNSPRSNEVVPLDGLVTYECKPWVIVDGSIFEPPTDVIFKNYSEVINTGMEYGTIE
jgi:hypothetical protein